MTDVIQLLPDNVANQIAAGEVVQRPASVVKELMENAIDAGATALHLIVRDAGKTLIQVIDNGCGMSETDARMCFERHATSKIREARDLFSIRTMGFRGEALASIAAVAQVDMRTRRATDELGTLVQVEDSIILAHEPISTHTGTNLSVRNLFYNVPARRNFLRSDTVEMRHVMDEFQRIALAHPDLFFTLHHNDQELFHLTPGSLRQRIVRMYGEILNKKLVPVRQDTELLNISGFIGNPEYFRRARGEQLFFVNNRFIKSNYLHHAVMSAYEDLLPAETYPFYALFLQLDPARIDVNVHPTKQEIKFDDEKVVYNILKVTVRHALGTHNVMPSLDFDAEPAFQTTRPSSSLQPPDTFQTPNRDEAARHRSNLNNWQKLYDDMAPEGRKEEEAPWKQPPNPGAVASVQQESHIRPEEPDPAIQEKKEPTQLHRQFILVQIKSGIMLIDQHLASERILFERYLDSMARQPASIQQLLFPRHLELSPADANTLRDIIPDLQKLGFDISPFGGHEFVVHGIPAELGQHGKEEDILERVIVQFREHLELQLGIHENLARAMARNAAIRRGRILTVQEMQELIDQLFACAMPGSSPGGKPCIKTIPLEELNKYFSV
jgi:DNA mismatch repair protein MutL